MTVSKPAFTPPQRRRIVVVAVAFPVVVAVAGAILMLSWLPELPSPISIHWDGAGTPDGFGTVLGLILPILGIAAVASALTAFAASTLPAPVVADRRASWTVALGVSFSAFITVALAASVVLQRGLADAADAPSPVTPIIGAVVVAVVIGAIAWPLVPRPAALDDAETPEPPSLALTADERALFSRSAKPTRTTIVVFFVGFLVVFGSSVWGLALSGEPLAWLGLLPVIVIVLAVVLLSGYWRVRITAAGVTARGLFGVPRFAIPLDDIAEASSIAVTPLADFGGWGIRLASGKTGLIVRGGEALQVSRTSGRTLVVTVDDATTAAALVNGMLQRDRSARGA